MTIDSINRDINMYSNKISERQIFIEKMGKLISNAGSSSDKLRLAHNSLSIGLIIGGSSADKGKLMDKANKIDAATRRISGLIQTANNEIKSYQSKINELKRKKERLLKEMKE